MADTIEYVTVVVTFKDGTVGILRPTVRAYTKRMRSERDRVITEHRAVLQVLNSNTNAVIIKDGKPYPRDQAIADRLHSIVVAMKDYPEWVRDATTERIEAELDKTALVNPSFARENRVSWRIVDNDSLPTADRPLWRDTGTEIMVDTSLLPAVMAQIDTMNAESPDAVKDRIINNLTPETRKSLMVQFQTSEVRKGA